MNDDNTLDARGPERKNVRDQVIARYVENLPPVRMFRRYQQDCIRLARQEYPDLTGPMSDQDVWEFTKAPRQ